MTVLTNTNSPYRTGTMKIQELAKAEILQGVMRLAVKAVTMSAYRLKS